MATETSAPTLAEMPGALAAREDVRETAERLTRGEKVSWEQVGGSSLALFLATLRKLAPQPIAVVLPTDDDLDALAADLEFFESPSLEFGGSISQERGSAVWTEREGLRLNVLSELARCARTSPGSSDGHGGLTPSARLGKSAPPLVLATTNALLQTVPSAESLARGRISLKKGETLDVDELQERLVYGGLKHVPQAEQPGDFARRGGILDVYPLGVERPFRLEFFDEELDSIREYDAQSQRSLGAKDSCDLLLELDDETPDQTLLEHLPQGAWLVLVELDKIDRQARVLRERHGDLPNVRTLPDLLKQAQPFGKLLASQLPTGASERVFALGVDTVQRLQVGIERATEELERLLPDNRVYVVCPTGGEADRLQQSLKELVDRNATHLKFLVGWISEGFRLRRERTIVVSSNEILERGRQRPLPKAHRTKAIDSFTDLRDGDLVVHLSHGIGRFRGMNMLSKGGSVEEHLEIEFRGGVKVYVPASRIDLIQRYIGSSKLRPTLATLGSKTWQKQTEAAREAVEDLAQEMLEVQAERSLRPGIAFNRQTEWLEEFERTFPYEETPDQDRAIHAVGVDMATPRPMDRLICGDVGFGKTEVAMRAAFRAVENGYQVAILAPTTVLVEQHFQSFRARMAAFPLRIARLSRFCTREEEKLNVKGIARGDVDIVIGTHRLASKDISFFKLGLVIIDEEQRFGVEVKERLKRTYPEIDVLTLSATPIPRTLHMSLVGIRDISNLETPPRARQAIETKVGRFDPDMIREAIIRELDRGGQIYFVHNRVHDIEELRERLKRIVPEAKMRVGHGQMAETELEKVMVDFVQDKFDMLLATTIVESGLDIPNANTIFIDEADKYGLADLHQLRGRVGRAGRDAYAYFLVDPGKLLNSTAARRLTAIEEYSEMGAGFQIAMRDLEIRGTGNLLGSQQSGHIAAVGYELYCRLLEEAIRRKKKEAPPLRIEVEVDLPGTAYLPDGYIGDRRAKIDLYRRLNRIDRFDELVSMREEMIDRFGPLPVEAERFLDVIEVRLEGAVWGISKMFVEDGRLMMKIDSKERQEALSQRSKRRIRTVDQRTSFANVPEAARTEEGYLAYAKALLRYAATST
ncbi:MAG TPA: transcription-repair coupling factor [Pirellulaceae bacterium]|jgi:transcription-repair coupling factor (superfamily II helicase)|nr:transcription-repair coupling factor [Pirellulaceae bacterium]